MRILLALLLASPAAADNHVTAASADLIVAPKLQESVVVMGRYGFRHAELETARMNLVDVHDDSLFDIRGSFLGAGARLGPVTIGAHLVTVWTDSYRYVTPYAALHLGAFSLTARSQGLYAAAVGEPPGRAFTRDFDLEGRIATPGRGARWEVRGRYRDIDVGETRVRDAMLCTGLRLAVARGETSWLPVFVGLGIRQERWRDEEPMGDVPMAAPRAPAWETLLWFAVDFGAEGQIWPN